VNCPPHGRPRSGRDAAHGHLLQPHGPLLVSCFVAKTSDRLDVTKYHCRRKVLISYVLETRGGTILDIVVKPCVMIMLWHSMHSCNQRQFFSA